MWEWMRCGWCDAKYDICTNITYDILDGINSMNDVWYGDSTEQCSPVKNDSKKLMKIVNKIEKY